MNRRAPVSGAAADAVYDASSGLWMRPGTSDPWIVRELRNYRHLEPKGGDVFVDVGANIGSVSRWLRASGSRVIAYEPEPENFALLERNSPSIDNRRAALTSDPTRGRVMLYVCRAANKARHTLTRRVGYEEIEVPAVFFGDAIAGATKLKIDCEGAEYDFLLGSPLPDAIESLAMEYHLDRTAWRPLAPLLHAELLDQGFLPIREPRFGEKSWVAFATYRR